MEKNGTMFLKNIEKYTYHNLTFTDHNNIVDRTGFKTHSVLFVFVFSMNEINRFVNVSKIKTIQ